MDESRLWNDFEDDLPGWEGAGSGLQESSSTCAMCRAPNEDGVGGVNGAQGGGGLSVSPQTLPLYPQTSHLERMAQRPGKLEESLPVAGTDPCHSVLARLGCDVSGALFSWRSLSFSYRATCYLPRRFFSHPSYPAGFCSLQPKTLDWIIQNILNLSKNPTIISFLIQTRFYKESKLHYIINVTLRCRI